MLDRYVAWVETYRETHLAFVRGAAGGDPWVSEVYEETRDPAGRRRARGARAARRRAAAGSWCCAWFAFTEDLVGQWTRDPRP